jgi:hypothetical protein
MTQNGNKQMEVTPAVQWKRQTQLVELPSGNVVEIMEIDISGFILSGDSSIPDFLTTQVLAGMNGGMNGQGSQPKEVEIGSDDFEKLLPFIERVATMTIVNPVIVTDRKPDYDNGEIHLSDIDVTDKIFLFTSLMPSQEMSAVASFREKPGASVGTVQQGPVIRETTK